MPSSARPNGELFSCRGVLPQTASCSDAFECCPKRRVVQLSSSVAPNGVLFDCLGELPQTVSCSAVLECCPKTASCSAVLKCCPQTATCSAALECCPKRRIRQQIRHLCDISGVRSKLGNICVCVGGPGGVWPTCARRARTNQSVPLLVTDSNRGHAHVSQDHGERTPGTRLSGS